MTKPAAALRRLALAAAFGGALASLAATPMPEFGSSVEFDKAGPQLALSKLKGKAVIVLFFQTADKTSSAWAGQLFEEMGENFGTNKTVVLVALKTDGGGTSAAKGFLTSKGASLDHWVVGSDKDARYATAITGDPSWFYVLVGPDGGIVERGKAGVTHNVTVGPDKKRVKHYDLANPALLKKCGKLATVLPADKAYDPALASLVRLAEYGDVEKALLLCTGLLSKPKERAAALELKADLEPIVEKRLAARVDLLKDAAADPGDRYVAYTELARMAADLKTHPFAAKANPFLVKARQEPALQKEARAENAYRMAMTRVEKASARDKPRLAKELENLSKQHAGTRFGQLMADVAADLAASAESP